MDSRGEVEAEVVVRRIQSKEADESIPHDLIPDTLLRLPAQSIVRFRCVSKLWSSITTRPDFISSFATHQSSTRLCLLVSIRTYTKRFFISLPQHEHPVTSYSHVDRCHINLSQFEYRQPYSESVHGLICLADSHGMAVWNPTMRQHVSLPEPEPEPKFMYICSCLGYDPVEDKYKVLGVSGKRCQDPLVFTLGPQESWRVTQNSPKHTSLGTMTQGTCINGNVYYPAKIRFKLGDTYQVEEILMSFDVRYEKFKTIRKPADDSRLYSHVHNYEGKVAWLCLDFSCIRFWVLEDEEKQEWSFQNFLLPFSLSLESDYIFAGITRDTGEFIYAIPRFEAIYVLYYDPKRNRTRKVEYEGIGDKEFRISNGIGSIRLSDIHFYPNHIESLTSLENVPRLVFEDISPTNSLDDFLRAF